MDSDPSPSTSTVGRSTTGSKVSVLTTLSLRLRPVRLSFGPETIVPVVFSYIV